MKFLLPVCLFYVSIVSAEIHSVHCPLGCPASPEGNDLVFGHVYALSNNPKTKFADWVAYEVTVSNFGPSPDRNWKSDPMLEESETLEEADYDGASNALKVDRGHQAPLASFAGSRYWPELNYLSNITPQSKGLNQGPWKALEEAVRDVATYKKPLFVITGPLYERDMPTLPRADESHVLPSGYFKLVYWENGLGAAYVMGQDLGRKAKFCQSQVDISVLESRVKFKLPSIRHSEELSLALGCGAN